jgi:hypothetical protein
MAATHVDEIKAEAAKAHKDATLRERLFDDMQAANKETAVRSAWVLTHLPASDNCHIERHREPLSRLAVTTENISLRRLTLALLERLDWRTAGDDVPEHYMVLLDFCLLHMMLADEPYGVRALCMKLAYQISLPYAELLNELRQSLLLLQPSELGPGVRHTRNKILNSL